MSDYEVAGVDELTPGNRMIVEINGREISVFNVDGELFAYLNYCAHQGGPLCEGEIVGMVDVAFDRDSLEYNVEWSRDGEIMSCPWHNWEFDLKTGNCLSRKGIQVPSYPVHIEDDKIIIEVNHMH